MRIKQRQHTRKYRSGKKTTVNRGIKRKIKHTSRLKGTIQRKERKVFNMLSRSDNFNTEFGGAIDFNKKGKIERIDVHPGTAYSVEFPDDYEIQYHTHPVRMPNPPSVPDVMALIESPNQQAEMVFTDGGHVFTIVKTPQSKKLFKGMSSKKAFNMLEEVNDEIAFKKGFTEKWKKYLEGLGFKVFVQTKSDAPIKVKIHPVEPFKRRRRRLK